MEVDVIGPWTARASVFSGVTVALVATPSSVEGAVSLARIRVNGRTEAEQSGGPGERIHLAVDVP